MQAFPALALGLMLSAAAAPAAGAGTCTRGWTGSVEYSRSQADSNSKTVERVSRKGTETTNWSMKYEYAAQVAVREAAEPGLSAGRANISVSSDSTETRSSQDQHMCSGERAPRTMSGQSVSRSATRASGGGLDANVHVSMNSGDAYGVGIRLPGVTGVASGSTSSSYSGQCVPKPGLNQSSAPTPVSIGAVTFSSSGKDRIEPSNPNRLSGSHSVTYQNVTETLRWNLRRCGPALRLVDVRFEDMRFPTWDAWQEVKEQAGVTDGNIVRITAIIANDGPEEKSARVKFRDGDKAAAGRSDTPLEDIGVNVPSGEQREVSFKWDSSGHAWYDDGRPRLVQRIKAEVEEAGKKADEMTRNIKVAPKPVLLVHGLWSNWKAWESWQGILTAGHSKDWKAFPVGQNPQFGRMSTGEEVGNLGPTNTISQNADQLKRYIEYAQRDRNAWHIDIVAHSMGGLISRRYIHASMPSYPDGKPQVQHLVMLGTPNMGSRCADLISAPLEAAGRSMDALRELRPSVAAQFNAIHTNAKGVKFSILAGNPLPSICYMLTANDGVVAVPSAIWTIADNAQQSVLHTDMATADGFSSFVKPRIAIGPAAQASGARLAVLAAPSAAATGRDAAAGELAESGPVAPDFSKIVKLAPGQAMKVAIPVKDGRNLGMTFVAASSVSATLVDDQGAPAGANLSGKPEASQLFRSLFVDRPVSKGSWTLELRNEAQVEREVVLSTWSNPR